MVVLLPLHNFNLRRRSPISPRKYVGVFIATPHYNYNVKIPKPD